MDNPNSSFAPEIQTTENCRYCLMCRHVCPVGHVTCIETFTPHGWALMIASERRGLLDWNVESVDKLYACADCGVCRAHCLTDQPLPDAIVAARNLVVQAGLAPPQVYELAECLRTWGTPWGAPLSEPAQAQGNVALFVGDEAYHRWPQAIDAARQLLDAIHLAPVPIGVGRNSGLVASSLGLRDVAQDLARATLQELSQVGAQELLALTPGDFYAFTQLYRERLDLPLPAEIAVIDVVTLLAERLTAGELTFRPFTLDAPWAYMDPPHAVRVDPRRHEAPRQLLAAILDSPPRELFWRRERAHPVGSLALSWTHPHVAEHLTRARLEDARRAGIRYLFSEDPGALAVLAPHAQSYGVEIRGLYEFLADRLHL
ncbi:hypothetical protein RY27_30595 [Litorilinea aerophila]|nr:hypothetical protein RY27_30595 [Litorilinea aerophila]